MVRAVLKKWETYDVWETPDTAQEKREIKQKKNFFMYETFCLIF